jgi:uncharacterized damage-inducible protein DinB
MTTMHYLKKLFSYDRWANTLYLQALDAQQGDRGVHLLSHIVAAQMLWMDRINKCQARAPVWPAWSLEECRKYCAKSGEEWRHLVGSLGDDKAQVMIAYKNSKGEPWESTVEDIAIHVANHGTHHRAQIAALLRADGTTPPYTDYIEGVRRGKVSAE